MRQQELSKIAEEDTLHLEGLTAVVAAKEAIIAAFNKVTPFSCLVHIHCICTGLRFTECIKLPITHHAH